MVMTTSLSTVSGAENVTIKFLHKYCQPEQAPVFEEIVKQYEEAHPVFTLKSKLLRIMKLNQS